METVVKLWTSFMMMTNVKETDITMSEYSVSTKMVHVYNVRNKNVNAGYIYNCYICVINTINIISTTCLP